eukprot:scaffold21051_cov111-Isochrysis_galbana.AAC.6
MLPLHWRCERLGTRWVCRWRAAHDGGCQAPGRDNVAPTPDQGGGPVASIGAHNHRGPKGGQSHALRWLRSRRQGRARSVQRDMAAHHSGADDVGKC